MTVRTVEEPSEYDTEGIYTHDFDHHPVAEVRDAAAQIEAAMTPILLPYHGDGFRGFGFDDDTEDGGSDRLADARIAGGGADAIAKRVSAHLDAGADWVCVSATNPDPEKMPLEQRRQLAEGLL